MIDIVKMLTEKNFTIAFMESCTGGGCANAITNVEGSSKVLKYSAVTYSNEFKIKMGVDKELIDKYTVYSIEVAKDMAKKICLFANSTFGVGVTGKLLKKDEDNDTPFDNIVYISIYDSINDKYYNDEITVYEVLRYKNKEIVINKIVENLKKVI